MATHDVEIRIRAIDQATAKIRNIDRALKDLNRVQGGYARAHAAQERYAGSVARTSVVAGGGRGGGSTFAPFGIPAGMVGMLGAGYGSKQVISAAADFEEALNEIRKRAGLTAEQTAKLGEEIQKVATSGEVIGTIDEIAKAYERGGAAGVAYEELGEFAIQAAKAADAFKMPAEETANAIAGWQSNLQLTNEQVKEMLDLVNALGDAGIADEDKIIGFMSRSGAPLMAKGFDPQQVAAIGSAMLNLSIDWEQGSRAINATTTRLLAPASKKSRGALNKLFGGPKGYKAFQETFSKDGMKGLEIFLDKIGSLDQLGQLEALNDIIGGEFGPIVQRLAAGRKALEDALALQRDRDSWFGGLDRSYDIKKSSFWSQWQLLKNEMATFSIDVGTMAMPALKESLEAARGVVQEIDQGLKDFHILIDRGDLDAARDALNQFSERLAAALNIEGSGSATWRFFQDIATAANDVSKMIADLKSIFDYLDKQAGAVRKALGFPAGKPEDQKLPGADREYLYGSVVIEEGGLADRLIEAGPFGVPGMLYNWLTGNDGDDDAQRRVEERANQRVGDAAGDGQAGKGDRLPRTALPTSVPVPPPSPRADMPPVTVPPPQLDTTEFMTRLNQIATAKHTFEQPLVTQADLSTAAFMAKLGQIERASAETARRIRANLSNISVTVPGGDGGSYDTNRRSQFAPVTP